MIFELISKILIQLINLFIQILNNQFQYQYLCANIHIIIKYLIIFVYLITCFTLYVEIFDKQWKQLYNKQYLRHHFNNISVYELNEQSLICSQFKQENQSEKEFTEKDSLLKNKQPLAGELEQQFIEDYARMQQDPEMNTEQQDEQNQLQEEMEEIENENILHHFHRNLIIVEKNNSSATEMLKQNAIISNLIFQPIQQWQDGNITSIFVYEKPDEDIWQQINQLDEITEMQAGQLLIQLIMICWQFSQRDLQILKSDFTYLYYNKKELQKGKLSIKLINIFDVALTQQDFCEENCRQPSIFRLIQQKCKQLSWLRQIIQDYLDYKSTPQEVMANFKIEWTWQQDEEIDMYPIKESLEGKDIVNKQQRIVWLMQFLIQVQYIHTPITLDNIYINLHTNELIIQENPEAQEQQKISKNIAQIAYSILNSDVTVIQQHSNFELEVEQFQWIIESLLNEEITLQQFINSRPIQYTLQTINYMETQQIYYDLFSLDNIEHIMSLDKLQNETTEYINKCTQFLFEKQQNFGKFFKLALYLLPVYVLKKICEQNKCKFNYFIYYYCKNNCNLYTENIKLQFIPGILARIQSFDYQIFITQNEQFLGFSDQNQQYRETKDIIFINQQVQIQGQEVYLQNFDSTRIYTNLVQVETENEITFETKQLYFNFQNKTKECKVSNIANPVNTNMGIDNWKNNEYKYIVLYLQYIFSDCILNAESCWSNEF